ncbi:unnamed protein product [Ixodes pacificus]
MHEQTCCLSTPIKIARVRTIILKLKPKGNDRHNSCSTAVTTNPKNGTMRVSWQCVERSARKTQPTLTNQSQLNTVNHPSSRLQPIC